MKHHIKQEPTIVLELTKEEFSLIYTAALLEHETHKKIHTDFLSEEYNSLLSEEVAIKLEEIYNSIK